MSRTPKVSVILPTYNSAEYLNASISSVLGQSFGDFELLVLDNASSDETPAVVAGFDDPRLRYRRNSANLGFAGNIELGRSLAGAPYVAVQNSDDQWEPDHLAAAAGLLDAVPRLAFVHGRITTIDAAGRPFGQIIGRWDRITPGKQAIANCFLAGFSFPSMVIRNSALRRVAAMPTDEPWGKFADSWLFLKLCLGGDVGFLSESQIRYRVHRTSMLFEAYCDGSFFRRRLAIARDLFGWPEVAGFVGGRDRRRILRRVAREAIAVLPLVRSEATRRQLLRAYFGIVAAVPGALAHPDPWARLAYGLLPRPAIERLRAGKRRWWMARHRQPLSLAASHE